MSASPESLAQFTEITGGTIEQAHFFLDSSAGNLELAVSTFFESGGNVPTDSGANVGDEVEMEDQEEDDDEEEEEEVRPTPAARTSAPPVAATGSSSNWGGGRTLSGASAPAATSGTPSPSPSRSATPSNPFRSNAPARVSTLRDLGSSAPPARAPSGRVNNSNDSDDDEDKDPLEFFTGGEKSGLSVENPNAKRGGTKDMVKGILQKAKEGGSRIAGLAGGTPAPAPQARSVFSGGGHKLGSDEVESSFIPDPSAPLSRSNNRVPGSFPGTSIEQDEDENLPVEDEVAVRHLTFWQDGFSIEDGDLMSYDENKEILAALNAGRAPLSLLKVRHDQQVELRIAKRLEEKWARQPAAPAGPFAGSGHRLGSIVPDDHAAPVAPASEPTNDITARPEISSLFEVDQNQPVTRLQIRLRDGTRILAHFNHTHTVGDVRAYINASRPGESTTNYALQTTFPSRDLTDEKATLKEANLLGSVVVQRGL